MADKDNDQSFAGVSATGLEARKVRREINADPRYMHGPTYLHEWHGSLRDLPSDARSLCIGMDVDGYPDSLLKSCEERGTPFRGLMVGVDFNPTRIQRLEHRFRDDSRFLFMVDDPQRLYFAEGRRDPFSHHVPSRSFDVVICTYALHDRDIQAPDRALAGLARALKEDGFCLVATHARGSFPEILEMYRQACEEAKLKYQARATFTHFDNFAQEDAQARLERVFDEVRLDPVDTSLVFLASDPAAVSIFMLYCDYFPFPELGRREVTETKRREVRARLHELAEQRLLEDGYLKISKPSGAFICRSPKY